MAEEKSHRHLYQPTFTPEQLALVSLAMSVMYGEVLQNMGLRNQEQVDKLVETAEEVVRSPEMRECIRNLNDQMMRLLAQAAIEKTIGLFQDAVEGIGIVFISVEEERESPPDLGTDG